MADTADLVCGEYRLKNVYGRVTPALAAEIEALWTSTGAIPPAEAARRTNEVAFVVRDAAGKLVGVNTVYVMDFLRQGEPYYFYRAFVRADDRRSFGVQPALVRETRLFLAQYPGTGGAPKPRGMVIVAENAKVGREGVRRRLERMGWHYFGKGPRGFDVYYINFDGSLLAAAPAAAK
jgi:hypothetical protein